MRIAYVYDRCYPYTIGGAERWYRELAAEMSHRHQVTYLTRRLWSKDHAPNEPFQTVAVAREATFYDKTGHRRSWPAIGFGLGVFWHLLRHGDEYDLVHAASFPYFSVVGAWAALRLRGRKPLVVDWHEVWTLEFWKSYSGSVAGTLGYAVQWLCLRLPNHNFAFSQLHLERLRARQRRGSAQFLAGQYSQAADFRTQPANQLPQHPVVVFAGRHIPEKGVALIPLVIDQVRRRIPDVGCVIFGEGPERETVTRAVQQLGLQDVVDTRGFVPDSEIKAAFRSAACLLLPSSREGYGLVVVEAAACGTPTVTVAGPDNAAVELIENGTNGLIAKTSNPETITEAVVQVIRSGEKMRHSTRLWFMAHASELSLASSVAAVEAAYDRLVGARKA